MPSENVLRIRSPEFQAMSERVLAVTTLTSRLNVLPFDDEVGRAELFEQILGFITMGHPVDVDERREWLTGGPIDVGENVWIGAGATILPGVSIGREAVIAAGAIVADDVPAGALVAGPKVLRS